MIARDPANRMLCYGFEGPEYKRSCETLDGERSSAVWQTTWELRTGGSYVAFADLVQSEKGRDRHVVVTQPFQVISAF